MDLKILLIVLTAWLFTGLVACLNILLGYDQCDLARGFYKEFNVKFEKYGDLIVSPVKIAIYLILLSVFLFFVFLFAGGPLEQNPYTCFLEGIGKHKTADNFMGKFAKLFSEIKESSWDKPLPGRSKEAQIEKLKKKLQKLED